MKTATATIHIKASRCRDCHFYRTYQEVGSTLSECTHPEAETETYVHHLQNPYDSFPSWCPLGFGKTN